ncbi:MAG: glycosyltransferase family 9 protein [Candidatus Kapaibacteriales bacterium]
MISFSKHKNNKILINDFRNIGIIQTAFIGDLILSVYLAEIIKHSHPRSNIIFVSNSKFGEVLKVFSLIDKVILYDKKNTHSGWEGLKIIANELKKHECDLMLSPHRSFRSAILTLLTHPRLSIGYKNASLAFLYNSRVPYLPYLHEIERIMSLLSIFEDIQIPNELPKISLSFSQEAQNFVENILSIDKSCKNIIIAPGSAWKTKQWKTNYFKIVAKKLTQLNYNVFITGTKDETNICEEIAHESGAIPLAGKISLEELLFLISLSSLLITNDSSPSHFATLTNTPCITIYGPTIPEFGFYPRSSKSAVIEIKDLKCRPCSIHGYNKCPLKQHQCMELIKPEFVLQKALEFLGE